MYIGTKPQSGFITTAKQRVTSSTNNYVDLDHSISSLSDCILWVNFIKQDSTNLTLTTSTRITLGANLVASDICEIAFLGKSVATQSPPIGGVSNDMLAGSIANSKLANSSVSINGSTLALGGSLTGIGETNTPYARLGFSSSPSVATGTFKVAEYNNILFANDNSIVDTTNYKITPAVAGKYYIAAHINYAQNAVDQKDYHLLIYVDGSNKVRNAVHASGNHSTYGTDVFVSGTLDLTASNYVQIKVYQASGSNSQYAYNDTTGIKIILNYLGLQHEYNT